MKTKQILLTGASGTIGSEVLRQLYSRTDIQLTIFDIKSKKSEKLFRKFKERVEVIYGDITNISDVNSAVKGKDVIIHLAAIIPPLADGQPELAEHINVGGTQNILQAMKNHAPEAIILYSSSVSVYGDRVENPNIRVGDALKPSAGDEYAVTKLKSEELIQKSGLKYSIFRLAAIMGSHKISKLMFHMPLNTTMEICTPADTARAFVNGANKTEIINGLILNIGGGPTCKTSYRSFLERSFSIFGLGKLNFAPYTFATRNFHCGYYADGDEAEGILQFRRETLEDLYESMSCKLTLYKKLNASAFRYFIKKYLEKLSEPLRAVKKKNRPMMERFFGLSLQ